MKTLETLKSIKEVKKVDHIYFTKEYLDRWEVLGTPKTLTHFDYNRRYIIHEWEHSYGKEYLWIIEDAEGRLFYHVGSTRD